MRCFDGGSFDSCLSDCWGFVAGKEDFLTSRFTLRRFPKLFERLRVFGGCSLAPFSCIVASHSSGQREKGEKKAVGGSKP